MSDRTVKIVIYSMIVVLGAFVFFLFFSQKVTPGTSKYYNGYDTFQVEETDTAHGPTYKITIYLSSDKNPYYIYTRASPQQVDKLSFDPNVVSNALSKKKYYVVIDPYQNLTGETTIAALEIDKFIDNKFLFNKPVNSAFTKPYQNYTVKTCADADTDTGIILLTTGPETKAFYDSGCVILQGQTQTDIVNLADALVFRMLKIIR